MAENDERRISPPAVGAPELDFASYPRRHIIVTQSESYSARLEIEYPETLDRLSSFFRMIWVIPIAVVLSLIYSTASQTIVIVSDSGEMVTKATSTGGGILGGLFAATMLMILFRQRYPRWWFDFALELTRFAARITAYMALLTDKYPSTVDAQSVHLDFDYPRCQTRPESVAASDQMALGDPSLPRACLSIPRSALCGALRLVRDPLYRPIPAGSLRLCGWRGKVGTEGECLRSTVGDR